MAKVLVTLKTGNRILQRDVVEAELVNAHVTVLSYQYGAGYGQAGWFDMLGRPISRPRAHIKLLEA